MELHAEYLIMTANYVRDIDNVNNNTIYNEKMICNIYEL